MKELIMIIAVFKAMIVLTAYMGVFFYTVDVTDEFYDKYEDIKNGDTEALNEFIENRANELVNMTIDEVQDMSRDILIDDILDGN